MRDFKKLTWTYIVEILIAICTGICLGVLATIAIVAIVL